MFHFFFFISLLFFISHVHTAKLDNVTQPLRAWCLHSIWIPIQNNSHSKISTNRKSCHSWTTDWSISVSHIFSLHYFLLTVLLLLRGSSFRPSGEGIWGGCQQGDSAADHPRSGAFHQLHLFRQGLHISWGQQAIRQCDREHSWGRWALKAERSHTAKMKVYGNKESESRLHQIFWISYD